MASDEDEVGGGIAALAARAKKADARGAEINEGSVDDGSVQEEQNNQPEGTASKKAAKKAPRRGKSGSKNRGSNTQTQQEEDQERDDDEVQQPGETPPNGGGQVPDQEGTQVGTSPGTSVARTEESPQVDDLDLSLRGVLADVVDPDQDWRKSGWQALRYRKKAVETAVKFGWRGYKTEQALVDAAIAAFLPDVLQQTAREMAERGEL